MLNILIIDDEQPARDRMRRMVEVIPESEVAGEASSAFEALEKIRDLKPDVVLLDISMPGMDGMELARLLQKQAVSPAVIFCTAFQDQALAAFDREAVDYLVKPVRAERLEQALGKARRYLGDRQQEEEQHFLRSTVGGKVVLTPLQKVICLLAEDKYTTVVFEGGETVIDESLTELEQRFPDVFFRIHRNALVSQRRIRGLERTGEGQILVTLSGTHKRPEVSRRNASALRKLLSHLS
jgi:two-component system response regulator AlgR